MVPDAPIDGKLPSVKPEDRSGDFTFSRGSNLAATRVNKGGLIEKGRENLLLQSNQFDTTWVASNGASLTSGQTGYDGLSDAWLLTKSTNNFSNINQSVSASGVNTYSVYAKGASTNFCLRDNVSGTRLEVNLNDGSIKLQQSGIIVANVEDVGGGWYRVSATFSEVLSVVQIYPKFNSADVVSVTIQDAQLEQGLAATGYIETTTAAVQKGILENLPRLDYSGGASCPSLLLEPQRSQLITQSEYFGSATWNKQNSIGVNTNSHLSPEGIQNATELDGFDSSNFQSVAQYITLSAGTYTFSVFLKKTTGALNHYPAVVMGSVYKYVIVNSTTGTYAESTGTNNNDSVTIESWDDNWWRVSLTNTLSAGAQRFAIYPALSANGTFITTNASGTNVFWGAQVEVGSYPTSYIPAYGTSQTRSGDNTGTIDVSSLGVTTGYTLFYELGDFNVALGGVWLAQSGGNDRPYQVFGATAVIKTTSGDVYPFNHGTSGKGTGIKVAVNYDGTNINVFTNGTKRGTWAANKTLWDSLTDLDMNLSSVQMVNWKQLLVFPTALTDDECIALTTI